MFCADMVPPSEIIHRIKALQTALKDLAMDGALIFQNTDLYYFTGTLQQAYLYVPNEGEPFLAVRRSLERAKAESPLSRIAPIGSLKQFPDMLRKNGYDIPKVLGMELDVIPAAVYLQSTGIFDRTKIKDVSHHIREIRAVKSEYEIGIIREAARRSDRLAKRMTELLADGVPEIELAAHIEAEARKMGHQGIVRMRLWGGELFYGHFMGGPSAAVPSFLSSPTGGAGISTAVSQGPSYRPIHKHEPILFDCAFAWNGYISDHTRIFSIGELPDNLLHAHNAMLDVQNVIKTYARTGAKTGDIYEAALERVQELGYAEWFMGYGQDRIRFVGHGVGLELDEYPFLAKGQSSVLQKGMILAAEPKLIFPHVGVVGIENTHLVTDSGLEQLTRFEEQVITV